MWEQPDIHRRAERPYPSPKTIPAPGMALSRPTAPPQQKPGSGASSKSIVLTKHSAFSLSLVLRHGQIPHATKKQRYCRNNAGETEEKGVGSWIKQHLNLNSWKFIRSYEASYEALCKMIYIKSTLLIFYSTLRTNKQAKPKSLLKSTLSRKPYRKCLSRGLIAITKMINNLLQTLIIAIASSCEFK